MSDNSTELARAAVKARISALTPEQVGLTAPAAAEAVAEALAKVETAGFWAFTSYLRDDDDRAVTFVQDQPAAERDLREQRRRRMAAAVRADVNPVRVAFKNIGKTASRGDLKVVDAANWREAFAWLRDAEGNPRGFIWWDSAEQGGVRVERQGTAAYFCGSNDLRRIAGDTDGLAGGKWWVGDGRYTEIERSRRDEAEGYDLLLVLATGV